MIFRLGLLLLFFLPVVESFDRYTGYILLLVGSLLLGLPILFRKRITFDFIDVLWLMLLGILAVTVVPSMSLSRSFAEFLRYLAYFIIYYSFRYYPDKDRLLNRFVSPMILVNSVILSFFFFLYRIPNINLPLPESGMNLFYATYRHNRIVDILVFAIPLVYAVMLQKKHYEKILYTILLVIFSLVFALSTALGALLSFAFSYFIFLFCIKRTFLMTDVYFSNQRKHNNRIVFPVLFAGVAAILFLSSSFLYSNIFNIKSKKIIRGFYKPASQEHRLSYFSQAIASFVENPLFGTGLDTFYYSSAKYSGDAKAVSSYAHNHYLEMFATAGFFGGLFFLVLFILLLHKTAFLVVVLKKKDYTSIEGSLLLGLIATGVLSLIDFNWHILSVFLILWIIFGVLIGDEKRRISLKFHTRYKLTVIFWLILLYTMQLFVLKNPDKVLLKVNSLRKGGMQDKALEVLVKYYRLNKYNSSLLASIASIYATDKDYQKAHFYYQKAVKNSFFEKKEYIGRDILLYTKEARYYIENNMTKEAVNVLKELQETYLPVLEEWGLYDDLLKVKRFGIAEKGKFWREYVDLIHALEGKSFELIVKQI